MILRPALFFLLKFCLVNGDASAGHPPEITIIILYKADIAFGLNNIESASEQWYVVPWNMACAAMSGNYGNITDAPGTSLGNVSLLCCFIPSVSSSSPEGPSNRVTTFHSASQSFTLRKVFLVFDSHVRIASHGPADCPLRVLMRIRI